VRAQAFGVPSFPVDTHIHRCALRWGLTDRLEERDPNKVSAALRRRFPEASWNKLHLQMIFMGREHCVAKNHSPSLCPICCWVNNDKGGHGAAAAAGGKGAASFSSSSPSSPSSPSPASPSAGAPKPNRETNSPKKHKGIIFYSDRKLELAASPHLVVDDTPAAVAASTAAAAAASAAAPSAAPEATKKKRGRLF
jgi:hypothetical protein